MTAPKLRHAELNSQHRPAKLGTRWIASATLESNDSRYDYITSDESYRRTAYYEETAHNSKLRLRHKSCSHICHS